MLNLKIVTLEKTIYQDDVDRVTIPTKAGVITVLPHHVPLVSLLAPGEMIVYKGDTKIELGMTSGFFEIRRGSQVLVMADTADKLEEMDIGEIQKAKDRVEKLLSDKQHITDVEFAHLEDVLGREISRLEIAHRYHKRRR